MLKILVCGHNEDFLIPKRDFLEKINLNQLPIGKYQNNQLAETRIFLSDINPVEYIGFVSSSYDAKFTSIDQPQAMKEGQKILPRLIHLNNLDLSPNILHCCILSHVQCKNWFVSHFEGIEPYLNDIEKFSGLSFNAYPSLLANSFVCHWDIFQKFMKLWRPIFDYVWDKYPINLLAKTIKGFADKNREAGYLYEAISMMVWAEIIKKEKLTIQHFSVPKKLLKLINKSCKYHSKNGC